MKQRAFTVYDNKAECYLPPFFTPEVGQATREFANAINSSSHAFARNPEDYTLTEVGTFDDNTGLLAALDQPVVHGVGITYVKQQTNNPIPPQE